MKPKFNGACVLSTGAEEVPSFILERCWDLAAFVPVGQEGNPAVTTAAAIALGRATGRVIVARKGVTVTASDDLTVYPCGTQSEALQKAYFQANACLGEREVRPDGAQSASVRPAPASAVVSDGARRSSRTGATSANPPSTTQGTRRTR